jgi:hypothetical protein
VKKITHIINTIEHLLLFTVTQNDTRIVKHELVCVRVVHGKATNALVPNNIFPSTFKNIINGLTQFIIYQYPGKYCPNSGVYLHVILFSIPCQMF